MIKKACLVFPRFKYRSGDPPLGLCHIASFLRKRSDVDVSILDTTFHTSFEYVKKYLKAKKPRLVGIYFDIIMFEDGRRVAALAKEMGIIVVAGGPHATVCPESLIEDVDIVVVGEGEETMADLIKTLPYNDLSNIKGIWYKDKSGNTHKNPNRDPIKELDCLEFPALDLVDMKQYFNYWHYLDSISPKSRGVNIMGSRGCPFNCSYCQPVLRRLFGNQVRFKSPEYLAREIQYYMDRYKVKQFFFHDDTFAADKIWAYRFFDIIKEQRLNIIWGCNSRLGDIDGVFLQRMHEAGLRCIHFGIESGSQRVLDEVYQKGTRLNRVYAVIGAAKKIGIHVGGFFMIGAPGEQKEEIDKTIRLAVSLRLDEATFSIVTLIPGTRLYDAASKNKKYKTTNNYSDLNYYRASYKSGDFSPRYLSYLQKKALFLFYLHPLRWRYIFRHLFSIRGLLRLYCKIRRFF